MDHTSHYLLQEKKTTQVISSNAVDFESSFIGFFPFDWIPPEDIDPEVFAILTRSDDPSNDLLNRNPSTVADLLSHQNGHEQLIQYLDNLHLNFRVSHVLETTQPVDIKALPSGWTRNVINIHRINDVRFLNVFFETINETLPEGGLFVGCAETLETQLQHRKKAYPDWLILSHSAALFIPQRVFPKLKITKKAYFSVTKGKNRIVSKAEVLGRLICCGFEIVDTVEIDKKMYFTVQKIKSPTYDPDPTYGPFIRLKRIGKEGKTITVYKIRTMYPYSEYLQAFIYFNNQIHENGKFRDDFRVTNWGRKIRKIWLDEIPMLLNWLLGDIKLVGVRPLSKQYLSIYPEELVRTRIRYKPGLIPPYYADLPNGLDEIISSEKQYLEAYSRHPIRTDMRYFFRVAYNIIVKKVRSH